MEKNLKYTASVSAICSLEQNWWLFGLRGITSIIFGLLVMFMPAPTILAITVFFGSYSLVDGIFSLIYGINRASKGRQWGWLILSGIVSIGAGLIILTVPHLISIVLMIFLWIMISIRSIITGVFEIAASRRLRQEIKGEWLLALNGILLLILGIGGVVLYWVNPLASIVTLCLFIGFNSLISGIILLLLAFKLYKCKEENHILII